ncbi:MAG: ABC transporter permease [Burkholderiaceae bacterium]|nr:ABC transporter permease [Burkholderiaceae bacterium]
MKALNRKLLRDLRLMWSQALTIALVVASGIAGFVTTLSAVESLAAARERYYAEGRFADVFASVERAPLSLLSQVRALPGVAQVQESTEFIVRIELPGVSDPILGQLIGVDRREPQRLNLVTVRGGRFEQAREALAQAGGGAGAAVIPALVSEAFAEAHGLRPGARLTALIDGRQRTLEVAGLALSPEYIFAGLWGMPDLRGFGVFWVDREVLAAAYDMEGAFNRLALRLAPSASPERQQAQVLADLERLLAPWGGRDPRGRRDQTSHAMLDNEIKEQQVMGSVLPAIFLGVAAFLLNVVVGRLVATQREQIAALKALGYANRQVAAHYLQLVLAIVALGALLGVTMGRWLGRLFLGLYAEFFRFPRFEHEMAPWLVLLSVGLAVGTAVAGTLGAILATVRLSPAAAMRPPAPGRYRPTLVERLGALPGLRRLLRLGPPTRMVLRNFERRPWRSALSVTGVAAAVAIVIMGNFFRDAIETIVDTTFTLSMRSDVSLWPTEPVAERMRFEIEHLPGVRAVESSRYVAVTLVNGVRRERSQIRGLPEQPQLYRIIDVDNREVRPGAGGLLLTDRLADKLGLRVGDGVRVEIQEGRPRQVELTVDGTVREMMGLNAYMERRALNRVLGEGDVASGFAVALEPGSEAAFLAAARGLPRLAGTFSKASMLRNMNEISARNVRIMSTVLTLFAGVIAVGVVYNNARIALAERAWELASLRVLGFTRGEVSALLLGELALVIALALPLGMVLGWALVNGIVDLLKSDQFHFPVVIQPRTYAWAALAVLGAGLASALVVRRRIDRLDMVQALKTRE